MLSIPSSVWKVCRFHYSLSHFTAALSVILPGSLRVRGNFCGLVSPDLKHEVREGTPMVTLGHKQLHVYLQTLKDRHVCWQPFITHRKAGGGFHGRGRVIDYCRMTVCFCRLKGSHFLGSLVFFQEAKTNQQGFACISATSPFEGPTATLLAVLGGQSWSGRHRLMMETPVWPVNKTERRLPSKRFA